MKKIFIRAWETKWKQSRQSKLFWHMPWDVACKRVGGHIAISDPVLLIHKCLASQVRLLSRSQYLHFTFLAWSSLASSSEAKLLRKSQTNTPPPHIPVFFSLAVYYFSKSFNHHIFPSFKFISLSLVGLLTLWLVAALTAVIFVAHIALTLLHVFICSINYPISPQGAFKFHVI